MSDQDKKQRKRRILRFAVTSALLLGTPAGCAESDPSPEPIPHRTNMPAEHDPPVAEPSDTTEVPPPVPRPTNLPAQPPPPTDPVEPTEVEPPPPAPRPPTRRNNAPARRGNIEGGDLFE